MVRGYINIYVRVGWLVDNICECKAVCVKSVKSVCKILIYIPMIGDKNMFYDF